MDFGVVLQTDPPAWRVVELGCGTGRNLAVFAERGALQLVGVDLSEGMPEGEVVRVICCELARMSALTALTGAPGSRRRPCAPWPGRW